MNFTMTHHELFKKGHHKIVPLIEAFYLHGTSIQ